MSNKTYLHNYTNFSDALHKLFNLFISHPTISDLITQFPLVHNQILSKNDFDELLCHCRDSIIFKWYIKSTTDYCQHFINLACPYLLKYPIKYTSEICSQCNCKECSFLYDYEDRSTYEKKQVKHCLTSVSPALSSISAPIDFKYFSLDPTITKKIQKMNFFSIQANNYTPINTRNLRELVEYPLINNLFLKTQYDYMIPISLITASYKHCTDTYLELNSFPVHYLDDYYIFSTLASLPSPQLKNFMNIKLSNYITENNLHKLANTPTALAPICLSYIPSYSDKTTLNHYYNIIQPPLLTENANYIKELEKLLSTDTAIINLYNQLLDFEYYLDLVTITYHFSDNSLLSSKNYDYFTIYQNYTSLDEIEKEIHHKFGFIKNNSRLLNNFKTTLTSPDLCKLFEQYNEKHSALPDYTKFINIKNFHKIRHLLPSLLQIICSYGQFPSSIYGSPFISDIVYRKNDTIKP